MTSFENIDKIKNASKPDSVCHKWPSNFPCLGHEDRFGYRAQAYRVKTLISDNHKNSGHIEYNIIRHLIRQLLVHILYIFFILSETRTGSNNDMRRYMSINSVNMIPK